jgi:hypothetical protein
VHGLGSNPDTTWRARKIATEPETTDEEEYVCWVTDFLPQDISPVFRQDIRVFLYNYDSFWQRDAVQTRLWNLGHNLLNRISSEIRRTEEVGKSSVSIYIKRLVTNTWPAIGSKSRLDLRRIQLWGSCHQASTCISCSRHKYRLLYL